MAKMVAQTLTVYVDVRLSFWQAFKLRLAGATYVENYVQRLLEDHFAKDREDDYS